MQPNTKPVKITTVEELCEMAGESLNSQDEAQMKIESILNYLQDCGVIDHYNADRLDWVFSDEECN